MSKLYLSVSNRLSNYPKGVFSVNPVSYQNAKIKENHCNCFSSNSNPALNYFKKISNKEINMKKYTNTGFIILKAIVTVVLIFISTLQSIAQSPVISNVSVPTTSCSVAGSHVINADVTTASGSISSVNLAYHNGTANTIPMTFVSGNTYTATIPAASPVDWAVSWKITATNSLSNSTTFSGTIYQDQSLLNATATGVATPNPVCQNSPVSLFGTINRCNFFEPFESSSFALTSFTTSTISGNAVPTATNNLTFASQGSSSILFNTTTPAGNNSVFDMQMSSNLNLKGFTAATLTFSHVAGIEGSGGTPSGFDYGTVEYSIDNGSNWVVFPATNYTGNAAPGIFTAGNVGFTRRSYPSWLTAFTTQTSAPVDNSLWQNETFQIPDTAFKVNQFKIRFKYKTDGSQIWFGWLIDNIKITTNPKIISSTALWTDGTNSAFGNPAILTPGSTTNYTATLTDSLGGCTMATTTDVTVITNPLPAAPTNNGTVTPQCGLPTFVVTSPVSGAVYKWYTVASGGSPIAGAGGPSYAYPGYVSSPGGTVNTLYVSVTNSSGCESPRFAISVSVTTPPVLTISPVTGSSVNTCVNSLGTSLSVTSPIGNYSSYIWSPIANLHTNNAIGGPAYTGISTTSPVYYQRVTPTTTPEVITLTATTGGCTSTATVSFSVFGIPVISSATGTPTTICAGGNVTLIAQTAIIDTGKAIIGTGTIRNTANASGSSTTATTDYPAPFGNWFSGSKDQMLILASELTAAGLSAGPITSVAFDVVTPSTEPLTDFTISMGATASTFLSTFLTPTTTVYTNTSYVPSATAGYAANTINFSTPFIWDGTSNIFIQTCFWNGAFNFDINAVFNQSATAFVSTLNSRNDNNSTCPGSAISGLYSQRPNMRLGGQVSTTGPGTYNWVWTPGPINNDTAIVSPIANQTYTVTATAGGICSATATVPITVTPYSGVAPTSSTASPQCGTPVFNVVAGPGTFRWYTAATGGTPIATGTSYTYVGYTPGGPNTLYCGVTIGAGCESPRVAITVAYTAPLALTTSLSGTINTCVNVANTINVTSTIGNFNSYIWSPLSNLFTSVGPDVAYAGTSVSSIIYKRATPTTTPDTVILQAFNSGTQCRSNVFVIFNVNANPVVTNVTATPTTVCVGGNVALNANSIIATEQSVAVGAGATTEFNNSPYRNGAASSKQQYLFTAAELTAVGFTTGPFKEISFFVTSLGNPTTLDDYTITLDSTSSNSLGATFLTTSASPNFGPQPYTVTAGLNTHTFGSSFNWNGTSNVFVQICHETTNQSGSSTVRADVIGARCTGTITFATGTSVCTNTTGNTSPNRPQITFKGQVGTDKTSLYSWSWVASPASGPIPSLPITTATPLVPGAPTTYTVTATVGGCTATGSANVTVNPASGVSPVDSTISLTQCGVPTFRAASSLVGAPLTFRWYNSPVATAPVFTSTSATNVATSYTYLAYTPNGPNTLYVSVTPTGGCEGTRLAITINDARPVLTLSQTGTATSPVTTCKDKFEEFKVVSNLSSFASYIWSPITNLYIDNLGTPYTGDSRTTLYYKRSTFTTVPDTILLTATTGASCVNTVKAYISVNDAPTFTTAATTSPLVSGTICVGPIGLTTAVNPIYPTTILSEDFNANAPGWQIVNGATSPSVSNWLFQPANFSGTFQGSGYLVFAKAAGGVDAPFNTANGGKFAATIWPFKVGTNTVATSTQLITPAFSLVGYTSPTLTFEHMYKKNTGDLIVKVEISQDGGTTWVAAPLANYLGTDQGTVSFFGHPAASGGTVPVSISLATYIGQANLKIRFNYSGSSNSYFWLIDDVKITGNKTVAHTYSWIPNVAGAATFTNPFLQSPTNVLINATTSFSVTVTNTYGCSSTSTTPVISVSSLDVTATNVDVLCFGGNTGTITATGAGGTGTYQYSITGKGGTYFPAVLAATPHTFSGLTAGSYTVFVKDAQGCFDSTIILVGQPTLLTLTAISITPPTCHNGCNGSMIVRGVGGVKPYRFSVNGGPLSGPIGGGGNYNILSLCTGTNQDSTYSVYILDSRGCNLTINVVLPNPALPTLNATNSGPVCANGSVTLTASPGGYTTYSWTGPGGYTASGASQVINPMLIADSGDYIVSIVSAAGCTNKDTTKIVVHPTVPSSVIISTPDTTVCATDLVTFTATPTNGGPGATYQFFKNTILVQNSASNTYGPLTVNNGDIVYVTMTPSINDTSNCSNGLPVNSGNITMIVAANVPSSVTLAVDKNPVCSGDSAKFTATPTGGGATPNYQFWVNGIMVQSGLSNTYTTNTLVNGNPVYVVMTSSLACATGSPATSSTINMSVLALPASPTNTSVATQCGTALVFSATAGAGTIKWYATNVSTIVLGSGSPFNYTGTLGSTTTLYVSLTNAAGCESPRVPAAVFASNYPTVSINGAATQTFCANASIVLSTTSTPGNGTIPAGNYQWYRNLGIIPGAVNSTYTATLPGSYTVTATNSNNCTTTSAAITLNTFVSPVVNITVDCNPILTGNSATFTADTTGSGGGSITYQWKLNGSTSVGAGLSTYTTGVAGNYTVIVTNGNSCIDTSNVIALSLSTAPLCGVYTIPGSGCTSFPTINAAATYLNNYGVSCAVTFNVASGHTETAPSGGIVLGSATLNSGPNATSTVKTITFQKNGAGAKPRVNAWVGNQVPSSAAPDGIWSLRGADFITIDGIDLLDNNAANPATMEYGFGLFKLNAGDGAQNNTIKNASVTLNRANNVTSGGTLMGLGSVGIQVVNVAASAATTAITPSSQAGANSNNKFYIDTIQNASGGIFIAGYADVTSPFTLADSSNIVGGSAPNACLIRNFGGVAGNPAAGIVTSAQNGINISYNTVNNNDGGGFNHPNVLFGIYNINPVGDANRPTVINNNTVTVKGLGTTQLVEAIDNVLVASTAAANIVTINNNTITGCSYSTATSGRFYGIVNSTPAANLSINNNVFSGNSTNATSDTTSMIYNSGLVTSALNINNNVINGFTYNAATGSGGFLGIRTGGTGVATCDASISGNSFQAITHALAGATFHQYIVDVQKTRSHFITSNNFNNLTINSTAGVTFINNDIGLPAGGSATINSNYITTAFNKTGVGGIVTLYLSNSDSSSASTTKTARFNNFSNITLAGATNMNGWSDLEGKAVFTGGGATKNISNNTFTNWACGTGTNVVAITMNKAGTGSRIGSNIIKNISSTVGITGIQTGTGNLGTHTIDSNYISKFTNSSSITGLQVANSIYTLLNVNNNTVDSLTSNAGSALIGMNFASNTSLASNVNVFKNKVYDLTSNFAGTQIVTGISMASLFVATNLNVNLYNNIVGNLYSPLGTAADAIRGIAVNPSGGSNGLYKVYYNTVYLNAVSSSVTFGSTGMYILSSTTATNYATDMRNNIIVNISTPGSTSGNTVAFRRNAGGAGALANYQATSNNNLFFAGTPAANRLIYFDGTSSAQTLAAYQAGVFTAGTIAPRDSASVTELPPFISTVGSNANFLHITAGANSFVESGAQTIAGFTDDYDNQVRASTGVGCSTGPDIGADEFVGVPNSTTWIGTTTDWNTGSNWCGGVVPTIFTNVKIPTAPSGGNFPIVPAAGSPFSVKNLLLQTGSSLTTAGNAQLSINGNYSATNVTLTNNGKITIAGTAAQSFPGTTTTVAAMQDLEINNTGGVTIDKSLTITGALMPKAGVVGLGNNFITLKSTPGATARVDSIGTTGNFTYGTGRFVIERYYPAKRRWHLRTSPVTVDAAKTVYNSWQVGGTAPAGSGTFVSGPGANPATNGLDVSPQNNNSLKSFVGQSFVNIGNTKTTLISGTAGVPTVPDNIGYFLFVRGDRTTLANFNVGTANTTTLRDTGKIQIKTQIFGCKDSIGGFTLMGNPYASPVDFSTLALNKVANKFWAWDPNLNVVGGYALVDIAGGTITIVPSGSGVIQQTKHIQSTQAVFVQTTATGSPTVTFTEPNKSSSDNPGVFRPNGTLGATESLIANLYLRENDGTLVLADGNLSQFDNGYSAAVDFDDAVKFGNINEQFSITKGTNSMCLERRPPATSGDTIFYKLTKTTQRGYSFNFVAENMDHPGLQGFLMDSYTQSSTPVNLNGPTTYDFNITADAASAASNRFMIVFKQNTVLPVTIKTIKAWKQNADIMVEWKVENQISMKEYEVEKSTDGIHFTKMNTTPVSGNNNGGSSTYNWLDVHPVTGVNYYRVRSISLSGNKAYSNIVKVIIGKEASSIVVSPNPVKNGIINLQLNNIPAGIYTARLFNNLGQLLTTASISHSAGSAVESIRPEHALVQGIYQLEIVGEDKTKTVIKVVVE